MTRVAHRGTTLIELLVVVSIIGSLMGILMPTLSSGRETGRSVVCASNLRQLQAANADYALDHRDRYMPAAKEMQFKNLHRWHGTRTNQNQPFDPSTGELVDYLNNSSISTQIRECPTFAQTLDALAESGDGFERGNGGYGYNAAFVGVERRATPQGMWELRTDTTGSRTNRFASPTRTIAFADSAFTGRDSLIEYSFVEPRFWPQWGQWRTDASVHFRHGSGANVVWLDGHVDSQQRSHSEPGWASRADAGTLGLGWFGVSDDNSLYDYD